MPENRETGRTILISRTDGLGDLIVTLPMVMALRNALPAARIGILVQPYTAPLARRIREIDAVLELPENLSPRRIIANFAPDSVVFAKPELSLAVAAWSARVPVRVGTAYRPYSAFFNRKARFHRKSGTQHEAEYGLKLLSELLPVPLEVEMPALAVSESGMAECERLFEEKDFSGKYWVVHPGGKGSAGKYRPEQYADVIERVSREFPELRTVLTAGPGEMRLALAVQETLSNPSIAMIASGLTLDGLSELLRRAAGFLGGSSGPVHLASLVGTPVVGLYPALPPMWPTRWRPIGERVTTLIPLAEEPNSRFCAKNEDQANCVDRIAPARVAAACSAMLAERLLRKADETEAK